MAPQSVPVVRLPVLEKKSPNEPADHALGRSRGGFSTKLHLVSDGNGVPLAAYLTPGQRHESIVFEAVMDEVSIKQSRGRPITRPRKLAGDKAYSQKRIRQWLAGKGIEAVIPQRSDQIRQHTAKPLKFDRKAYRQRNVVERCIGWLKECRRLSTRYEKLAENFLAMVTLAMIQRYLAIGFSDTA